MTSHNSFERPGDAGPNQPSNQGSGAQPGQYQPFQQPRPQYPNQQASGQQLPWQPVPQAPAPNTTNPAGASASGQPRRENTNQPRFGGTKQPDQQRPAGGPAPLSSYGTRATSGAPSSYGTPPPRSPQKTERRNKKAKTGRGARATVVVLTLLLPLVAIGGAVAGYLLANSVNSYSERKLESEVANVLRDDFGLTDVDKVNCPAWVKVEQGNQFQCEFEYGGATQTVTVTQTAQSGQLVVGAPETGE